GERLLGHEERRGAALGFAHQMFEIDTRDARHRAAERRRDQSRVLAHGCQDQEPMLEVIGWPRAHVFVLISGTPVRTPRYSRSGSPITMRPPFMLKSRMPRSCSPPRILTTEIACRTSPSASK